MVPDAKPSVLLMLQLPPPVHGASVMNRMVASSERLKARFDLQVLDINMNREHATLRALTLRKLAGSLGLSLRLMGKLLRRRPHLVYLTLSPVGLAFYRDLAFIAILKLFGCRRAYHLHGRGIDCAAKTSALRRLMYRWAFAGADVIALCDTATEDVRRIADARRIQILNNGIEDVFPDLATSARRTPPPSSPVRILFLSNLIAEKGPFVLLEALAELHRAGYDFVADIAGAWRLRADAERFRSLLETHGLAARVKMHGPVHGERKRTLMREASIFALPTYYRFETFPLSILEAMAAGLAVVTTRHAGIPEMIIDGVSGVLVPVKDAAALAKAIKELLDNPTAMHALGQQARSRFEERFTAQAFEARLADMFSNLVAAGAR
jgi:glycosyltransferase involved in cell wall biosynthesis